MKTKLTLFVTVLATALFVSGCSSLNQGLVAYYPFNGDAKDKSGKGNHAEVRGANLSSDRHGKTNCAYVFDGNSKIAVVSAKSLDSNNTISCWVMIPQRDDLKSMYLVSLGEGHSNNNWIEIQSEAGRWYLRTGNGSGGVWGYSRFNSNWTLVREKWFHAVNTYDGKTRKLYVDGIIDRAGKMPPKEAKGINIGIGVMGFMDDIRIYSRALSAEEVKALYDLEKPTEGN